MQLIDNPKGHFQFLTGIAPYSSGVIAVPGYEIVHVTLQTPLPYRQGFALIDQCLRAQDRSRHALCGIELRSPKPFAFEGFARFNQGYQHVLADWDLPVGGINPVARTNVAPEVGPPAEPSLYAFSYTATCDTPTDSPTFVIAGAGEMRGAALSPDAIVRAGETSVEALRAKAAHVMQVMQTRLTGLGATWSDVTAVDVYTVHSLQPFLAATILDEMGPAAGHGIHWFYSRPPIVGVEFEMDMRGVRRQIRLA
ncbi:MAG: RidA family protein [Ardenticatenia bacterium]|nr:RidA family protein [Ardenticatenia bacterium]